MTIYVEGVQLHKPWGTEVMLAAASGYELWELCMRPGTATSFHFHRQKHTGFVVVRGAGRLVVDDRVERVAQLEFDFIPANTPHRVVADTAMLVWELESPADKNDIHRISDDHGRAGRHFLFGSSVVASETTNVSPVKLPSSLLHRLLERFAEAEVLPNRTSEIQDIATRLLRQAERWSVIGETP